MIAQTKLEIKRYWQNWAIKRNRRGTPQTLHSRNLYILPSGFGWAYGFVILLLFIGAINYQANTIFLMTFLLATIGLVSAWEANANLKNLSFKLIGIEDAQQGTPAKITLLIQANNKVRFSIEFRVASQLSIRLEKTPLQEIQLVVPIQTADRGYFALPPITISSRYPFGIFKVWGYIYFEEYYYVYPRPIDPGFWPVPYVDQDITKKHMMGDEELYELKQVENPWVAPNLIAWRIAAKGQGWYLKTMNSYEAQYWLFKLNDLPAKNLEIKLQHLSHWLQTAELNGLMYGLELNTSTQFSRGKEHLKYCLRQLALYQ